MVGDSQMRPMVPTNATAADVEPEESKLISTITRILDIPKTGRKILETLATTRKNLSVKELVGHVKRSERSIRTHLRILIEKKILDREVKVTAAKKLAYQYSLQPPEKLLSIVRREIQEQLEEIDALHQRLKRRRKVKQTKKNGNAARSGKS